MWWERHAMAITLEDVIGLPGWAYEGLVYYISGMTDTYNGAAGHFIPCNTTVVLDFIVNSTPDYWGDDIFIHPSDWIRPGPTPELCTHVLRPYPNG
jgi:hypothetical protein